MFLSFSEEIKRIEKQLSLLSSTISCDKAGKTVIMHPMVYENADEALKAKEDPSFRIKKAAIHNFLKGFAS